MENTILHVNNWGLLGGIECTVMDFAKAFPQFFAQVRRERGENDKYLAEFQTSDE